MAEKRIKTRIQSKHGKASDWALATNFKPYPGEIIIYDAETAADSPKIKVGDGNTVVGSLPFVNEQELKTLSSNTADLSGKFESNKTETNSRLSEVENSLNTLSTTYSTKAELNEYITTGTADPDATTPGRFYFKY